MGQYRVSTRSAQGQTGAAAGSASGQHAHQQVHGWGTHAELGLAHADVFEAHVVQAGLVPSKAWEQYGSAWASMGQHGSA